MVKRTLISALAIVLVTGVCVWLFAPKPEDKVIRQLSSLSNLIRKAPDEKPMESLLKAKSISDLFAPECSLAMSKNPLSGTYSPNEMSALALQLRGRFTRVAVTFNDPGVTFPDDQTAEVLMLTNVRGETEVGRVDEILESKCRLRCIEDTWLFAEFRVISTLEK